MCDPGNETSTTKAGYDAANTDVRRTTSNKTRGTGKETQLLAEGTEKQKGPIKTAHTKNKTQAQCLKYQITERSTPPPFSCVSQLYQTATINIYIYI